MNCLYQFRPVGQGCFFTGIFSRKNIQVLNFVFDCGTDTGGPHLNNAIKTFKSELKTVGGKPTIDLLMISHFDDDHVIGVLELLKGVKCRNLVMPFLSVFERLALFSKGDPKAEWHKSFLRNPVAFIRNNDFEVDHVFFIDGNSPKNEAGQPVVFSIDPHSPSPENFESSTPAYLADDEIKFDSKFHYFKLPFELEAIASDWKFKFYIKPYDPAIISKFHDEVKTVFAGRTIAELFNDYDRLLLKGLYKKIFKDRNKSSLCVAVVKKAFTGVFYHDNPNLLFSYDNRETTILLTGDSALKSKKDIKSFTSHYHTELDTVLLFQVPHHGSKYNSRLDNSSQLWNFPIYVINHGSKSKSHPNPNVISFITTNRKNLWQNTELREFSLSYDVNI